MNAGRLRNMFLTLAVFGLAGCDSVHLNYNRVPRTSVYVPFTTESEWHEYGVGGALQSRRFIRQERVPGNYPYPDYSYTGYGGVLLTCDVMSAIHVFDLSCPVERRPDVRIVIGSDNFARCPQCGSVYDVFQIERNPGDPVSGPAFAEGYGLRSYRLLYGVDGRYALISL